MVASGGDRPGWLARIATSLLAPGSIMIVGAAERAAGQAGLAARLRRFGFAGEVVELAWPATRALPHADLGLFDLVPDQLAACIPAAAAAGIGCGVALGPAPDPAACVALARACAAAAFPLLGPGDAGIVSAANGLVAIAADPGEIGAELPAGGVALVAQAGRVGLALLRAARKRHRGLRHVIGTGAEAGLGAADVIGALCQDEGTRTIALCLDGLRDGAALRAALAAARGAGRRVVVLHDGIPEAARPGPDVPGHRVREALLEAEGVVSVDSHRELLDVALYLDSLARVGLPRGRGVAILTGGGGGGVIAADLCGRYGLDVPPLSAATREALVPLVPAIASTANPVDLTPEMFNERFYDRFPAVLDLVAADPAVDAILLPTTFNAPRGNVIAAQVLSDFHARSPKPVLIGAPGAPDMQTVFAGMGVAPVADTASAVRALARLVARHALPEPPPADAAAEDATGARWPSDPARALPDLLDAAGWEVAAPHRTDGPAAALLEAGAALGFPLVLAVVARDGAAHGLAPVDDICDAAELAAARERLVARAQAAGVQLSGFTLRRDLPGTLPLRVLGFRDPAFGLLLACGAGGLHARVLEDLVIEPAPFDAGRARALLGRSRSVGHALRMNRALALDGAAEALARLSRLVAAAPWPSFLLRLDPVVLREGRPQVLDLGFSFGSSAADARRTA